MSDDNKCYEKAQAAGESTFTLVSHDQTAPRTIAFWIVENIETARPEKLHDALDDAIRMRQFYPRRMPD